MSVILSTLISLDNVRFSRLDPVYDVSLQIIQIAPLSSPRNVNLIGTNKETDTKILLLMFALFKQVPKSLNAH